MYLRCKYAGAVASLALGWAVLGAAQQPSLVRPSKPFTVEISSIPAKIYSELDKSRVDMGQVFAVPKLKGYSEGTLPASYTLLFYKTRKWYAVAPSLRVCVYDVVPPGRMGCDDPINVLLMSPPKASANTKITALGEETVGGVRCTVERLTSSDPNVAPPGGLKMWVSKDLGILVKAEGRGPDGKPMTLVSLDSVTLGKADPKLFVPPAYCQYAAGSAPPCK